MAARINRFRPPPREPWPPSPCWRRPQGSFWPFSDEPLDGRRCLKMGQKQTRRGTPLTSIALARRKRVCPDERISAGAGRPDRAGHLWSVHGFSGRRDGSRPTDRQCDRSGIWPRYPGGLGIFGRSNWCRKIQTEMGPFDTNGPPDAAAAPAAGTYEKGRRRRPFPGQATRSIT
jgi:hypothetical protein